MGLTLENVEDDLLHSRYGYFIRSDGKIGYEDENNVLYTIDITVRASGGTVPAPKPVRETFRVELLPADRELLKQIAENTKPRTIPNAVPGAPTLPFVGDTWSWRNPVIYGSSGTQVNSTFDHQGERP